MRKRAQWKGLSVQDEIKHNVQPTEPETVKRHFKFNKNWWIAITLIGIFLLVLFLNTYYNMTTDITVNPDGQGLEKYYLSGPDPYYNLRLVKGTYETGKYPYYYDSDPLLNYPMGARGGRAPLFNMMALGFSRVLVPFMNEQDAIAFSMQFLPALYGALLIFVVYFIGKELFNKKVGLIAAFFIAIIPAHLSSGHGSAFGLFDHDSFNLLMFFLTFLFLIKSIKEKDSTKSLLYSILGGVSVAALSLVWVEAEYLYVVIAIYAGVQMLIDIFTNKIESKTFRNTSVLLWSGYLISMPVIALTPTGFASNVTFYICIAVTLFGAIYYLFGRLKMPWTISLPAIFLTGVVGLLFIYFAKQFASISPILSPITNLTDKIFGTGIYGNKVSMTIAEANKYQISNTVMSFGPALYWISWIGFIFLCYQYYKNKYRKDYLFIIVLFLMDIWLTGIAGRFVNDMVPLIALLGGWIVWFFIDKINYKQMIRNVRAAGGGLHGIRRGVKFLHIFGIIFVALIVILPSAYVAFDAAIPSAMDPKDPTKVLKTEMFGADYQGAFGLGVYKERYWAAALNWLNQQDTDIVNPVKRPAFISWWDYGFYEVALGGHPTVADNFQDGIPPAANFETSTSENEAVCVWIVRLLEANRDINGGLTDNVMEVLTRHLGVENATKIETWMNNLVSNSTGKPIGAEYDVKTSEEYKQGQQYPENPVYHDIVALLTNETTGLGLSDEEITWLYHDLQNTTGWSVRYYGVEGYDKQIFNIFGFLADKSLILVNGIGDDFIDLYYTGYTVDSKGNKLQDMTWTSKEIKAMSLADRQQIAVTGNTQVYKDPYFETMFYRTYIGPYKIDEQTGSKVEYDYQIPCNDMKHFYAEYLSDIYLYPYYDTGKAAVVIAKYYEGAYINGTVYFNGEPVVAQVAVQKNLTYSDLRNLSFPIEHDTYETNESNDVFHLIAGAGADLQIRRILGDSVVIIKNVTFDGADGQEFAPISDYDAMRKSDNYERFLNISIQPANISGKIFDDKDNDGIFNSSIDQPLKNINVAATEILIIKNQIDQTTGQTQQTINKTGNTVNVKSDENGSYNISGLLPGLYRLEFYDENNNLFDIADKELNEGNNSYNVKKPKPSNLEGKVFYDKNLDGEYNAGEEISGVDVKLYHYDLQTGMEKLENETTTGANGTYSFKELFPGNINGKDLNVYIVNATKGLNYTYESAVYPVENETTIENISLSLVPVNVNGFTKYADEVVGGITVNFDPDTSKEFNTAKTNQITSGSNGSYLVALSPGEYNVSISKIEGSTLAYSFNGKLNLSIGQGSESYDISMIKNSASVSGITSYQNTGVPNVTIDFENVNNTLIENAESNETGSYSIELAPGVYNVTAESEMFNESGVNYTYRWTGTLTINEDDIAIGRILQIPLVKESD